MWGSDGLPALMYQGFERNGLPHKAHFQPAKVHEWPARCTYCSPSIHFCRPNYTGIPPIYTLPGQPTRSPTKVHNGPPRYTLLWVSPRFSVEKLLATCTYPVCFSSIFSSCISEPLLSCGLEHSSAADLQGWSLGGLPIELVTQGVLWPALRLFRV